MIPNTLTIDTILAHPTETINAVIKAGDNASERISLAIKEHFAVDGVTIKSYTQHNTTPFCASIECILDGYDETELFQLDQVWFY